MKLYYSPGACSLAPHIALREAGLPFEAIRADLRAKKLPDGSDYLAVNPRGQVPVLQLDDGSTLTENSAILQYIADQVPASQLAPAAGTMGRYRLQEWLSFVSSELHKSFGPLFNPALPAEAKPVFVQAVETRLKWIDSQLAERHFLLGDRYSVADGYLFVVNSWSPRVGVNTSGLDHLKAHNARVAARPAVQAALQAEGLTK